jgi:hypothetical protein
MTISSELAFKYNLIRRVARTFKPRNSQQTALRWSVTLERQLQEIICFAFGPSRGCSRMDNGILATAMTYSNAAILKQL